MYNASSADFRRSKAPRRTHGSFTFCLLGILTFGPSLGCASSGDEEEKCEPYSCACGTGVRESASAGGSARCAGSPLCNDVSDCPAALSGTSEPICEDFGDQIVNGHSGSCRLPCRSDEECPDGAFCNIFCWFEAED